jgi:hypothetical protein
MKADIAKKMADLKAHLPGGLHAAAPGDAHKKRSALTKETSPADLPGVRFVSFFCDDNRVS